MDALTGARWSAASRCPRQAAYGLLGAFGEALPPRTQGLYDRGHDVEDAWCRRQGIEPGLAQAKRQYEVQWGLGWTAHVDVVWPYDPDRRHVEVKSTVNPDHLPGSPVTWNGVETTSAVLQVAGATHFDPLGGTCEVVAVSPVDYSEQVYPITLTDDLCALADETADLVVNAAERGETPPRACKRPSEGYSRFCPYVNTCFADWEEPSPLRLSGEYAKLAHELAGLEDAYRSTGQRSKELKQQRDEAREQIRDALPGAGDYTIGGIHIRLTEVKGRETFSLADAVAAGLLTREEAEPFIRRGEPGERWQVGVEDE